MTTKLLYYPGCTLRSMAIPFDQSTKEVATVLGIELVELSDITCCGALYPQTTENLMPLLAPARVLVQAQRLDSNQRLMTLCSFCYNTLKRTNKTLKEDAKKRSIISEYLEEPYNGEVQIIHLLEVLRDDIGYSVIEQKVANNNKLNLRVVPYYGCLLLRPYEEIGLDDPEQPSIFEDLLTALGCEVIDFPWKTDCCGSYLIVSNPKLADECSQSIIQHAKQLGADALITSCPLCHYNLTRQINNSHNYNNISILYFTQLMGMILGIEKEKLGLQQQV